MTKSAVTAERFAKGMTFDEYVTYVGSPENLAREGFGSYHPDAGSVGAPRKDNSAVFRKRYVRARLTDHQTAAIKWLVAQPGGPANILVISEDWSSDCRRDVPVLARLAEAGGLGLRIFNRDGKRILWMRRPDPAAAPDANYDLMLEFMNVKDGGEWASLPAVTGSISSRLRRAAHALFGAENTPALLTASIASSGRSWIIRPIEA